MTMAESQFLELLLRGGVMAITLLTAARVVRVDLGLRLPNLAALFAFGMAAYVIISAPASVVLPAAMRSGLAFIATMNSAFFWWFTTALFDDDFRWNALRIAPGVFLVGLYLTRALVPAWTAGRWDELAQQLMIIAMMCHALFLAIRHYQHDLVERRRQFRLAFATVVACTGIITAAVELYLDGAYAPAGLALFHASVLFCLSFFFCHWLLASEDVLALRLVHSAAAMDSDEFPLRIRERLDTLMADGLYREEGLTIRVLATHLGMPEYRLRRMINQGLGYKNFNAYLNDFRVKDARGILADPAQANRQITLIAVDLGYGSIATFNRAFKQLTGDTPSTFRKYALASPGPAQTH